MDGKEKPFLKNFINNFCLPVVVNTFYRGLYYKSSIDCFLKTARQEGFLAMYKGFFPAWIRMGYGSRVYSSLN